MDDLQNFLKSVPPLPEALYDFQDEIIQGFKRGWIIGTRHDRKLRDSGPANYVHIPVNVNGISRNSGVRVVFQINLGELPEYIHQNRLPRTGMVFVVHKDYDSDNPIEVIFYRRSVDTLEYAQVQQTKKSKPPKPSLGFLETWTPPLLFIDDRFEYMEFMELDYYDWMEKAFPWRGQDFLQVGGNMTSCQPFYQENQDKFVAQMTHLDWLYDMGEINLYYSEDRGFYIHLHSH